MQIVSNGVNFINVKSCFLRKIRILAQICRLLNKYRLLHRFKFRAVRREI